MTDSKTIEKLLNEQIDNRNISVDEFVKIDWHEDWEEDNRNIYLDIISEETVTIQKLKKLLSDAKDSEEILEFRSSLSKR